MVNDKDKLSEMICYLKKKVDKLSEKNDLDENVNSDMDEDMDEDIGDESHIVIEKLKKCKRESKLLYDKPEKPLIEQIKELEK